jgi:hypothetical protein
MRNANRSPETRALGQRRVSPAAWRQERLLDAGFPRGMAARLARDPRYDLHLLIQLVERGAPPEVAERIIAPTDADGAAA